MRRRVLDLAARRPLTLAAALTLLWHVLLFAVEDLIPPLAPDWFPDLGAAVVNVLLAALTVLLVVWLRWQRETALVWRWPDRSWWLLTPLLAEGLVHLEAGLTGSVTVLVSAALTMLAVGIAEESLSRGLVQRVLTPLGRTPAAIWVGVLFGVGHLLSGLWFGRPLDFVAWQVLNTFCFGFCLAAVRWHVGTIWPLVFLHALVDFTSINSPGSLPDGVQEVIVVLLVAYGWWLLRLLDRRDASAGRADQPGDDLRRQGDQGQPAAGVRRPTDQEQPGQR